MIEGKVYQSKTVPYRGQGMYLQIKKTHGVGSIRVFDNNGFLSNILTVDTPEWNPEIEGEFLINPWGKNEQVCMFLHSIGWLIPSKEQVIVTDEEEGDLAMSVCFLNHEAMGIPLLLNTKEELPFRLGQRVWVYCNNAIRPTQGTIVDKVHDLSAWYVITDNNRNDLIDPSRPLPKSFIASYLYACPEDSEKLKDQLLDVSHTLYRFSEEIDEEVAPRGRVKNSVIQMQEDPHAIDITDVEDLEEEEEDLEEVDEAINTTDEEQEEVGNDTE